MTPKVFISYSWSSPEHQTRVREWAERLLADSVDVVLDTYDLKEGQDKYAFMERMVHDSTVTHVLVVSDSVYATKADAREAGVGTESQIISQEVYESVEQSKFVPIVTEFDGMDKPCLPVFLKSRIWLDFSSPEAVNSNWERLVRHLFGKPLFEKPPLGKPPGFLAEQPPHPSSPAQGKLALYRQAVLQGKKGLHLYRHDFFESLIAHVDSLRVRVQPNQETFSQDTLGLADKLRPDRNLLVDWLFLESDASSQDELVVLLHALMERLLGVKGRPPEVSSYNDIWFGAHNVFVCECFLYIVAALLKLGMYRALHELFTTHYLKPEADRSSEEPFVAFRGFWGGADALQQVLAPPGQRLNSPAAALMKRHADRQDLRWPDIMEADLLAFLMGLLSADHPWFPQTLHYAGYSQVFPFFLRASQHRAFESLAQITGVASADELRTRVKAGLTRFEQYRWEGLHYIGFGKVLNLDKLDTIT